MSFELTGKLTVVNDTQQITETFKKREFVIEKSETANNGQVYTDYIKLQFVGDKCDILDSFVLGNNVKVSFNIKGRKWEKDGKVSYFISLDAWRIEGLDVVDNPQPTQEEQPEANTDDLPF